MKKATAHNLRSDFARLSKWLEKGETIEIIKRGKHVADLVPKPGKKRTTLLGCTPSPLAEIANLSQFVICELAEKIDRGGKKELEKQQLSQSTLQAITAEVAELMRTFPKISRVFVSVA